MKWIGAAEVAKIIGVQRRTVLERYRVWTDFPRPFKLGLRSPPLWREDEVLGWMEEQRQRVA